MLNTLYSVLTVQYTNYIIGSKRCWSRTWRHAFVLPPLPSRHARVPPCCCSGLSSSPGVWPCLGGAVPALGHAQLARGRAACSHLCAAGQSDWPGEGLQWSSTVAKQYRCSILCISTVTTTGTQHTATVPARPGWMRILGLSVRGLHLTFPLPALGLDADRQPHLRLAPRNERTPLEKQARRGPCHEPQSTF